MTTYDLAGLWEAHCRYEFETRDVDATMSTMVAEPYVNHIPTMTGGVGHDKLREFYANHFIGVNPPDMELSPVSLTVGESPWSTSSSCASRIPADRLDVARRRTDRASRGDTHGGDRAVRG